MINISVVIPAYNCAGTLCSTVESVLASGISNYEVILIDDGSIDGTEQLCDTLAEKNDRIRCIHQKNAGVSAARNRGLDEAKGEYIWFFDADDSAKSNSMAPIERILLDESPDMLVFGLELNYYHKGSLYRREKMLPAVIGKINVAECSSHLYSLFLSNSLSSLCTRLMKRRILVDSAIRLREEMILYEDLEFVLRVQKQCGSIYFYPKVIYLYRQSEDEGNAGRRLKRISHIPELIAKISEPLADEADKQKILLALYLTLAREKISVSTTKEIKLICKDFRSWIDEQRLLPTIEQRTYPMMLYRSQVTKLMIRRSYSRLRHHAANRLKQIIGDFRKW